MNFAVLPVAGGLYDQHPQLLEEWAILFRVQADHEKEKQERREREMKAKTRSKGR